MDMNILSPIQPSIQSKDHAAASTEPKLPIPNQAYHPAHFVGQCPQMKQMKILALNIAMRPINTMILGESGTGKEVFARMIHFNSPRSDRPFVAINCTAISDTLFESEMFGIEKGVATGVTARKGYFEQAHTGTLFLDEIGDMSPVNQAKLLRVIEEQEVLRVGGAAPIKLDVKLISATNANLEAAVAEGRFRQDLFFRLNVVELVLPPLRQRGTDILALAQTLLEKNCKKLDRAPLTLSEETGQYLMAHDWPGNVRELNNEMERAAALAQSDPVQPGDLSPRVLKNQPFPPKGLLGTNAGFGAPDHDLNQDLNLAALEQETVARAMELTGGNKTKAAEVLGITREGLRKKLIRFNN